jgi:hypothetical protein
MLGDDMTKAFFVDRLRPRRGGLGVLAVMSLAAGLLSAAAPAAAKEDIVLSLKNKVIRDLSSAGLTLTFEIGALNKSASDRDLVRARYRFTVNQREYLNMSVDIDPPIAAPAGQETLIALPVKITYAYLFDIVGQVVDRASCDIVGDLIFTDARGREEKASFAFPGEFPIFKDPGIEILPLKVNDLTLGGADVEFRTRFDNPNPYELLVERISFHLFFGDKDVLSGDIPGDKSLPSAGGKMFAMPFLIDFFEGGQELREDFKKPSFPCRFKGEVLISSAWGPLRLEFDKTVDLAVEKSS